MNKNSNSNSSCNSNSNRSSELGIYGLLSIFLFLELTLIRFSLRAASCGKYLAGPYHDERLGSDFSKVSTVSSAVPFFLSRGFHLCPFHIERNTHYAGCP